MEEKTMEDWVFFEVARIDIPNFFVTVEFSRKGIERPKQIEAFLLDKYHSIQRGAEGRKFVLNENGWRMIFTFFPKDKVVDERYALKNKVQLIRNR